MKKLLLSLALIVSGLYGFSAETVEFDFATNDYGLTRGGNAYHADGTTLVEGDVTITLNKISGNGWRLWNDGLRAYKGEPTMSITTSGRKIVQISFTQTNGVITKINGNSVSGPEITYTASGGTSQDLAFTCSKNGAIITLSVELEGEGGDVNIPTDVTLSFPENAYTANLGEEFNAPVLSWDPVDAASAVEYSSSNPLVATVDASTGAVEIVGVGETEISVSFAGNDNYKAASAKYSLTVIDPNAEPSLSYTIVFNNNSSDSSSPISESDALNWITEGKEYVSSFSDIDKVYKGKTGLKFSNSSVGGTMTIHLSQAGQVKATSIVVKAQKFGSDASALAVNYSESQTIGTNLEEYTFTVTDQTPLSTIVLDATKRLYVKAITVNYAEEGGDSGDESKVFTAEAFKNYTIEEDDIVEFTLPEDAPEITFTSSDPDIATVEDGYLLALAPGNVTITASWDAVEGVWKAGSAKLNVTVTAKPVVYNDLASLLENAKDGDEFTANFAVIVAYTNGNYHYVIDEDCTVWALIYDDNASKLTYGSLLPKGWKAKYTLYNGLPELTNIKYEDITDGGYEEFVEIETYNDLMVSDMKINEIIVLNDVIFASKTPAKSQNATAAYNGQKLTFRNQFGTAAKEAGTYNVTCAVGIYETKSSSTIQLYPIEYAEQAVTSTPDHTETILEVGGNVEFIEVENGAHIYYRHGGEDPDHTNVFTEAAQQQVKRLAVDTSWTYNHTTHPLTFTGEEMLVKYIAKAPGKAPSRISTLSISGDGQTTSITEINAAVKDAETVYDLMGRKVAAPVRGGLYIVNGAKHIAR